MQHPRRVFSREELLDAVLGPDIHVEPRTVDVHIRRLRKSINADGETRHRPHRPRRRLRAGHREHLTSPSPLRGEGALLYQPFTRVQIAITSSEPSTT